MREPPPDPRTLAVREALQAAFGVPPDPAFVLRGEAAVRAAAAELDGAQPPVPLGRASFQRRLQRWSSIAAAALLTATMGGAAVASTGALPGDRLYPVKGLVEHLRTWATLDPAGDARLHLLFAQRRLDEALALLRADRAVGDLATAFEAHVSAALRLSGGTLGPDVAALRDRWERLLDGAPGGAGEGDRAGGSPGSEHSGGDADDRRAPAEPEAPEGQGPADDADDADDTGDAEAPADDADDAEAPATVHEQEEPEKPETREPAGDDDDTEPVELPEAEDNEEAEEVEEPDVSEGPEPEEGEHEEGEPAAEPENPEPMEPDEGDDSDPAEDPEPAH